MDLIEKKPTGLLPLLDEICVLNRKTDTDMTYLTSLNNTHRGMTKVRSDEGGGLKQSDSSISPTNLLTIFRLSLRSSPPLAPRSTTGFPDSLGTTPS